MVEHFAGPCFHLNNPCSVIIIQYITAQRSFCDIWKSTLFMLTELLVKLKFILVILMSVQTGRSHSDRS